MAALLVALSIMAVMMTVAMPVWKHTAQREKEEELVFRGKQYAHAIGLFQRKFANAYPPNLDTLVDQRFLRKKFKDPITNDDFVPILVGQALPGTTQPAGGQRGASGTSGASGASGSSGTSGGASGGSGSTPGAGGRQTAPSTAPSGGRAGGPTTSSFGTTGGVQGVTSKSKAQSIRLYNGRGHYNEWLFVWVQTQQAAGAGAPGTAAPGQRGQPGQPPGAPGGAPPGGQRGPGPFGPTGPNGPGTGGLGTFGGGGVMPIQPPSTPRGRF